MVFSFLREGLRSGDRCLCAFEAADRAAVDAVDAEVSAEVDVASAGHQLDIRLSSDILLGLTDFSAQEMLDYWHTWVTDSLSGFSAVRALADIPLAVRAVIGGANFIRLESEVNRFVPRYPVVVLCLYDLDRFGGDLLVDVMKTHPKVLMGSTVLENPYYVPPDQLAANLR
jgi:hypothetical protein